MKIIGSGAALVLAVLLGACGGELSEASAGNSEKGAQAAEEGSESPPASSQPCHAYMLGSPFTFVVEISAKPDAQKWSVLACVDDQCERFPLGPSRLLEVRMHGAADLELSLEDSASGAHLEGKFLLDERPKGTRTVVSVALLDESGARVGGERGALEWDYAPWDHRPVPAGAEGFSCHTSAIVAERSQL